MAGIFEGLEEAWNLYKEAEAFSGAVQEVKDIVVGDKRKSSTPKSGETRGGKRFRRPISTASAHNSISSVSHRRINSGEVMKRTSAPGHDEEVAVIPPPRRIAKIQPDYFTIDLPFFDRQLLTGPTTNVMTSTYYRLNSPYDPSVQQLATQHQPMGRDKFKAFGYKYYRVLKTQVNIKWLQAKQTTGTDMQLHTMVGFELTDDSTVDQIKDYRAFVEGKQTSGKILLSPNVSFAGSDGHTADQSYVYSPENWDFHVQQSGIEERWTPIDESPPNPHFIGLHCGAAFENASVTTEAIFYIHLKYTVQFREVEALTDIDKQND